MPKKKKMERKPAEFVGFNGFKLEL